MTKRSTTAERLSVLETEYGYLNKKVDRIMENHLPHIQSAIDDVKDEIVELRIDFTKIATKMAIIVGLATVIVDQLVKNIFSV